MLLELRQSRCVVVPVARSRQSRCRHNGPHALRAPEQTPTKRPGDRTGPFQPPPAVDSRRSRDAGCGRARGPIASSCAIGSWAIAATGRTITGRHQPKISGTLTADNSTTRSGTLTRDRWPRPSPSPARRTVRTGGQPGATSNAKPAATRAKQQHTDTREPGCHHDREIAFQNGDELLCRWRRRVASTQAAFDGTGARCHRSERRR